MSWFDPRAFGTGRASHPRAGKVFGLGACVAVLVGLTGVGTGGFAKSPTFFAAAKKKGFVPVCAQRQGRL